MYYRTDEANTQVWDTLHKPYGHPFVIQKHSEKSSTAGLESNPENPSNLGTLVISL